MIAKGVLLLFLFTQSLAQNEKLQVPPGLEKEYYKQLEKLKNYKPPEISPEEKKKLEEKISNLQENVIKEKEQKKHAEIKIPQDTHFYLFMSSSVPKIIWERYMDFVENAKLQNNVFFVLRGCINGCKYIKPTLNFIQSIQKDRQIQVIIDPFLFRRFGIKEVPCLGMAKGDKLFDPNLSAGWNENLQTRGQEFLSCGDWSMAYHFKILCEKSKDQTVCDLARKYGM